MCGGHAAAAAFSPALRRTRCARHASRVLTAGSSWVKPKDLKPFRCAAHDEYVNKQYKYKGYAEAVALCQQREVDLGRVPPPGFVPADAPSKVKSITIKQGGETIGKTLGKRAKSSAAPAAAKKKRTAAGGSFARIAADQATINSLSEELARWMSASDVSGVLLCLLHCSASFCLSASPSRSSPRHPPGSFLLCNPAVSPPLCILCRCCCSYFAISL